MVPSGAASPRDHFEENRIQCHIMPKKIVLALLITSATVILPLLAEGQESIPEPTQRTNVPYRLFRTQNIYTLLKLDTRTGLLWQVQWGTDAGFRWVAAINPKPLWDGKENGRFTLCPTLNIYTFVLIDQQDGRQWQVQWGKDKDHRLIIPILTEAE
jgi:hypothetical protein